MLAALAHHCRPIPLFDHHSDPQLYALVCKMTPRNLAAGEVLFQLGEKGTSMFVLYTGELSCIIKDGTEVKVLVQGERRILGFALDYGSLRGWSLASGLMVCAMYEL